MDQRDKARERANHVRKVRKDLRRHISDLPHPEGRAALAKLLLDPPSEIATAPCLDVLKWVKRMYTREAERILMDAGLVNLVRGVGELSLRQRLVVVDALDAGVRQREAA